MGVLPRCERDARGEFLRAVVTGGAGFLGSHLCDLLLDAGWSVVCADNLLTGAAKNVEHLRERGRFTFVRQDVAGPLMLPGPVDYVFHLASPAQGRRTYGELAVETLRVLLFGTYNVLQFSLAAGARLVYVSSSEVYGDPEVVPQAETYWGNCNPVGERSVYGEGKRFGESMTKVFRDLGLNAVIVRPFNAYGPRMGVNDGRVVPSFLRAAFAGDPLVVAGDGSQTRSFCYVADTVRGIYAAGVSKEIGPINIGNAEEVSMLELARAVLRATGSENEIVFAPLPEDDPKRRVPDITLARDRLGWEPSVMLEEGLRRTVEWCRTRDE